jgi:hypothetical protein
MLKELTMKRELIQVKVVIFMIGFVMNLINSLKGKDLWQNYDKTLIS